MEHKIFAVGAGWLGTLLGPEGTPCEGFLLVVASGLCVSNASRVVGVVIAGGLGCGCVLSVA